MLSAILLSALALISDDPPRPQSKARTAAGLVLDLKGKVEIRPIEGPARVAELGDLVYPGEKLAVPVDGSATLSILSAGTKETLKASTESTVGLKGCTPADAVATRKEQPKSVASTMKGLRSVAGDPRKAGVGFRSAPEESRAITPIFAATIPQDRPTLAWPVADKADTYRVKLLSGANRELWRAETKEPRLVFPDGKPSLEPGNLYHWEVTDQDYRKVATGKFSLATTAERAQFDELKALAESGDRADRYAAALGYRKLYAYAEAIAVYESLVQESRDEPAFQRGLAELRALAGRNGP